MPTVNLPSLRSLRYFEAAGRCGSFTAAAAELDIGQSAISHRIRSLEEQLGYRLFNRSKLGVQLTDQGEFYFGVVSKAFDQIAVATKQLNPMTNASFINLTVTPLISSRWLIPRIQAFTEANPDIHLNLSHSEKRINAETIKGYMEDQVVISYRRTVPKNWAQELLFSTGLVPMCNPTLLPEGKTLIEPEDLLSMPLAHEKDRRWWTQWFEMAGIFSPRVPLGPIIDAPMSLIEAALNGQAVVLASPLLFQDYLSARQLTMPVGDRLKIPIDYCLMLPNQVGNTSGVRKFVKWIRKQSSDMISPEY